ncbi:MAG: hypothetical protein F6J86_33645 [Symploca sp. SIO1B1]|nr:hypothetical protein [Symploca sp. SIO1C2]NER98715.1 hypothetical protein [Symploca sp. SIO1B1]
MPSQTFIVRAHSRTIYTKPLTFVCGKCQQMTTRECYPGNPPKYCLKCSPKRKKASETQKQERGMFNATHHLVASSGKKTEVCLEQTPQPGWYWVRTALDWFAGESIIQFHQEKGLHSQGTPLSGYSLEVLAVQNVTEAPPSKALPALAVRPYKVKEVCQRFRCSDKVLKRLRTTPEFADWTKSRDPEGIAWEWKEGKYFPLI